MARVVAGVSSGQFGSFASAAVPFAPSVPLSTVAVTNPATAPMTVVITGGTMTAVIINGVTAGTGAGTYTVPGQAAISMTYSAAPTWAWSSPVVFTAALNANGTPVARTGAS